MSGSGAEVSVGGMKAVIKEVAGGSPIEMVNHPKDSATLFFDGLHGVSISPNFVKIFCIEQLPIEGQVFGRYVANLVIPVVEFSKISSIFNMVSEQIAAAGGQAEQ